MCCAFKRSTTRTRHRGGISLHHTGLRLHPPDAANTSALQSTHYCKATVGQTIIQTHTTKGMCRIVVTDTQTGMLPGIPGSAICVQGFDDSLNSAIHTTYRISLRPSSLRLPRHPWFAIVKVFCFKTITHTNSVRPPFGFTLSGCFSC